MENEKIIKFADNLLMNDMPLNVNSISWYIEHKKELLHEMEKGTEEFRKIVEDSLQRDYDKLKNRYHKSVNSIYTLEKLQLKNFASEFTLHTVTQKVDYSAHRIRFATEKDLVIERLTKAEWLASKQVFSISKELADSLLESAEDELTFSVDLVSHLPFTSFILELPELYLGLESNHVLVGVQGLKKNMWFYSGFVNKDSSMGESMVWMISGLVEEGLRPTDLICWKEDEENNYSTFSKLMISIILYLCSERPDVKEAPETKTTYRKTKHPAMVKNKNREIKKWDIGVRYAASIKAHQKKLDTYNPVTVTEGTSNMGSPKRPHIRKGHWHHYRIGPGRNKLILKWLGPTYVNADWDSDLPIVIHNEKEESKN